MSAQDVIDGEGPEGFPDYANKPFADAEVGVSLFWVDGIDRYVFVRPDGNSKQRFSISFMVNSGRLPVNKCQLPVPTAQHLVWKFFDRDSLMLSSHPFHGCFVTQYVYMLAREPDVEWEEALKRLRSDPWFFEGVGT